MTVVATPIRLTVASFPTLSGFRYDRWLLVTPHASQRLGHSTVE